MPTAGREDGFFEGRGWLLSREIATKWLLQTEEDIDALAVQSRTKKVNPSINYIKLGHHEIIFNPQQCSRPQQSETL